MATAAKAAGLHVSAPPWLRLSTCATGSVWQTSWMTRVLCTTPEASGYLPMVEHYLERLGLGQRNVGKCHPSSPGDVGATLTNSCRHCRTGRPSKSSCSTKPLRTPRPVWVVSGTVATGAWVMVRGEARSRFAVGRPLDNLTRRCW
ncbi:hypothetical protein B0H66DRAFT_536039 [Apodospora peruviana]|uniref:Uncharacterized protein n=1 Tax=Apodospora peruviana TaxID=516989 RepID=A0AAE0M220_9PEZI|nr:hypothetical protein B0H66DRAFT_536039 [Apodospora peruviana]